MAKVFPLEFRPQIFYWLIAEIRPRDPNSTKPANLYQYQADT